MILAVDVYYSDAGARVAGYLFNDWHAATPDAVLTEHIDEVADYVPGAFYQRELPCIVQLLRQVDLGKLQCIVIDGYVVLDDAGMYGLGGHLFEALGGAIPVVGVAKTRFLRNTRLHAAVYRGQSTNPLFVTAIGMDLEAAAACVRCMHGIYRMPDLLKQLDAESRKTR